MPPYCKYCNSYHTDDELCIIKDTENIRSILIENREQLNLYFMQSANNWIH